MLLGGVQAFSVWRGEYRFAHMLLELRGIQDKASTELHEK